MLFRKYCEAEIFSLGCKSSSPLLKEPLSAKAKWYGEVEHTLGLLVRSSELDMEDILNSKKIVRLLFGEKLHLRIHSPLGKSIKLVTGSNTNVTLSYHCSAWFVLVWNFQYYKKVACYQMSSDNYLFR